MEKKLFSVRDHKYFRQLKYVSKKIKLLLELFESKNQFFPHCTLGLLF